MYLKNQNEISINPRLKMIVSYITTVVIGNKYKYT